MSPVRQHEVTRSPGHKLTEQWSWTDRFVRKPLVILQETHTTPPAMLASGRKLHTELLTGSGKEATLSAHLDVTTEHFASCRFSFPTWGLITHN